MQKKKFPVAFWHKLTPIPINAMLLRRCFTKVSFYFMESLKEIKYSCKFVFFKFQKYLKRDCYYANMEYKVKKLTMKFKTVCL